MGNKKKALYKLETMVIALLNGFIVSSFVIMLVNGISISLNVPTLIIGVAVIVGQIILHEYVNALAFKIQIDMTLIIIADCIVVYSMISLKETDIPLLIICVAVGIVANTYWFRVYKAVFTVVSLDSMSIYGGVPFIRLDGSEDIDAYMRVTSHNIIKIYEEGNLYKRYAKQVKYFYITTCIYCVSIGLIASTHIMYIGGLQ